VASTAHIDCFARDNLPPRDQWPELLFERPELQFPQRLNCATAILERQALGPGGSRPALESFIAFRGREPSIDALLRHNGMTN